MTLAAGSVGVDITEVRTGSGLAVALYDADVATRTLPTVPTLGDTTGAFAPGRPCNSGDVTVIKNARLAILYDAARLANAYASAIIPYLTTNAVTHQTISVGGLQKTPSPNNAATATDAPASPVFLTGTLT